MRNAVNEAYTIFRHTIFLGRRTMNIGQAAKAAGLNPKIIRYYESIGLIGATRRSGSGYRDFDDKDVQVLRFIKRSRELGFSIERIRSLLSLWDNKGRQSAEVKSLAQQYIAEVDQDMARMQAIRDQLQTLADSCTGDHRPECPIIDSLAGNPLTPELRQAA
jgi:MerR family transcriptional regulator, copper efflux regulator